MTYTVSNTYGIAGALSITIRSKAGDIHGVVMPCRKD